MKLRCTKRALLGCLGLALVLVVGIVQWSLLPLLVQPASLTGNATVQLSAGHASRSASAFKAFLAIPLNPFSATYGRFVPRVVESYLAISPALTIHRDDNVLSLRQFRSPPLS